MSGLPKQCPSCGGFCGTTPCSYGKGRKRLRTNEALEEENDNLKTTIEKLCDAINKQAEDEGLWFDAKTAPEAYLQAELRKLHRMIENETS